MPRGYPKNPNNKRSRSISEIAKETTPLDAKKPVKTPNTTINPVNKDLLLAADITVPSVKDTAENDGLTATNAYAVKRISDLSRQEVMAKSLKIKQIARQKNYRLDALVHNPQQLQSALDDYDITCFNLGFFPLQHLLAVWLNTTAAQIIALSSAANVSESGQIIATHNDYCISVVSLAAIQSDKPPLFSIYYLKTAYQMFDQEKEKGTYSGNLSLFSGNITQNITVNAADISKNSQLFAEIDSSNTGTGKK